MKCVCVNWFRGPTSVSLGNSVKRFLSQSDIKPKPSITCLALVTGSMFMMSLVHCFIEARFDSHAAVVTHVAISLVETGFLFLRGDPAQ